MRHPTVLFFSGLVAAVVLWAGVAAVTPRAGWPAHRGMMGSSSLIFGPGAWGAMHASGAGPYILSQTGGMPQTSDVERAMDQWIILEGNPRLKLGPVTEKDSSIFQADVLTKEGSLVQRFNIDCKSGRITPVED